MHLVFERSTGKFKSNCNILSLAWTPYYNEAKFRWALFEYHQRQLINLSSNSNAAGQNEALLGADPTQRVANARAAQGRGEESSSTSGATSASTARPATSFQNFLNSRVAELHQRHTCLRKPPARKSQKKSASDGGDKEESKTSKLTNSSSIVAELDSNYGRMPDFGWLVVGNVGKIVGVTLTSTAAPLPPKPLDRHLNEEDLIKFQEEPTKETNTRSMGSEAFRPDDVSLRDNYNLRGHLDEVILVKWNELYQKLATIDSKGNVLIWCKINEKFTIQTPFYNRTKSVADFKWSNDGKTALICYTDSFILVGSSSGQRHWHSMLNLDDYHITCASWTPNDEQLLLGVSNGNVVVIDLPRSELTEIVVNQTNIRTMCWSTSDLSLTNLEVELQQTAIGSPGRADGGDSMSNAKSEATSDRRRSLVVNHRRLSRDCSVFSRYRFCSQAPYNVGSRSPGGAVLQPLSGLSPSNSPLEPRVFNFRCPSESDQGPSSKGKLRNILAIDFANNTIKLYDGGLDDPSPRTIHVNQESYIMHWSSDGKYLAVAGFNIHTTAPSVGCLRCRYLNAIKFYNQQGELVYEHTMSYTRYPITAFTWAHDDRRLFVATGPRIHCAKVFLGIPPLSLLAVSCLQRHTKTPDKNDILDMIMERRFISPAVMSWQSFNCPVDLKQSTTKQGAHQDNLILTKSMEGDDDEQGCEPVKPTTCHNSNVYQFRLPLKLQIKIDDLFRQTIRQPFDEHWSMNDIIWHVPNDERRYYCTLVCYTSDTEINSSGCQYRSNLMDKVADNHSSDEYKIFVLYVEFQGSLIPILRARRVGFLKPEFVIFDPEDGQAKMQRYRKVSDISQQSSLMEGFYQRRWEQQQQLNQAYHYQQRHYQTSDYSQSVYNSQFHYSNEGFTDNCSDFHLYSEPRASNSSLGRQSMSDAEHYYNFDGDPVTRSGATPNKLADLMTDRSHHQEPLALPMSGNPYLVYMMALVDNQQHSKAGCHKTSAKMSVGKRHKDRHKTSSNLATSSSLTENNELVRVKSNVWGTKFKLINVGNQTLRRRFVLGSYVYKTSFFHLLPRQIFLNIKDMSHYCCLCSEHHHTKIRRHQRKQTMLESNDSKSPDDKKNNISLIDMPNLDDASTMMSSSGGKNKRDKEDEKVFLSYGDSIRIAPLGDRKTKTRSAHGTKLRDPMMPSTSREGNEQSRALLNGPKRLTESLARGSVCRRRHKSRSANQQNAGTAPTVDQHQYPSSETHSGGGILSGCDIRRSNVSFKPAPASNSLRDLSGQQEDDILTLSLDQGDRVRVEMSSLASLKSSEFGTERAPSRVGRTIKGVDDFLATNKTLKSIQTITKMIVDLSSRADDLEISRNSELANDLPSPSKVARISTDNSPCNQPSGASKFVPPETPIHRPRRVPTSRLLADLQLADMGSNCNQFPERARSATSTPLKGIGETPESRRSSRRNRLDGRAHQLAQTPLPPPPPSIPIGRRLSSSAKRFIDGSLRSLYSGGSGYSMSAAEPEEKELLVSESTFRAKLAKELLKQQPSTTAVTRRSQPCSPAKRESSTKLSGNDLSRSFRVQLMQRLRGGEKPTPDTLIASAGSSPYQGAASSRLDRFNIATNTNKSHRKSGWRYTNSGGNRPGTSSLNDSGLQLNSLDSQPKDLRYSLRRLEYHNSSDSSPSSAYEEEDDDEFNNYDPDVDEDLRPYGESDLDREERDCKMLRWEHLQEERAKKGLPPIDTRPRRICPSSRCCCKREFKLSNRPPVWNEVCQVYQLDFGGRVTQESAKNLQIDYAGKLALQFGRIDRGTYTLDYKYPFNAVQAMAIAMASITQRLK